MPIVIRANGPLNDITEGLAKGIQQGQQMADQQAAIADAKKRREQDQQRLEMQKSQQDLEQSIAQSKEQFDVGQRAYTQTVQGQAQTSRTAEQAGNASALAEAQQRDQTRLSGLSAAAVKGGPIGAAVYSAQDAAQLAEAQAVARQMDPERGRQYVLDETQRIRQRNADALRPKLIQAWQQTLTNAQGGTDPNNPTSMAAQDPKVLARAQTNIQGLQSGAIDPETSMQHFQIQQQDIQEKRIEENRKKNTTALIGNQIARLKEAAQLHPEMADEAMARVEEAQTYLDQMNDPSLTPVDVRELGQRASSALFGRGQMQGKKTVSPYMQARDLANKDVELFMKSPKAATMSADEISSLLDKQTMRHLEAINAESGRGQGGGQAAPAPSGYDPMERFTQPFAPGEVGSPAGAPQVNAAKPVQAAKSLAAAPNTIEGWGKLAPQDRDSMLTDIALRDPATAIGIAKQLGLGGPSAPSPSSAQPAQPGLVRGATRPVAAESTPAWYDVPKRPEAVAREARDAAQSEADSAATAKADAARKANETPTPEEMQTMRKLWADSTPEGTRKANEYVGEWLRKRGLDWGVIKRLRAKE